MSLNLILAHWVLSIWNPDMLNFIGNKQRREYQRLHYRTRGIVLHDRMLNGETNEP